MILIARLTRVRARPDKNPTTIKRDLRAVREGERAHPKVEDKEGEIVELRTCTVVGRELMGPLLIARGCTRVAEGRNIMRGT